MRLVLLAAWVLLVPAAFAYHKGAGQTQTRLDAVADHLTVAQGLTAGATPDYPAAVAAYDEALKALPEARKTEGRAIRVERAKAMMLAKQLPEAHADLNSLVDELQDDPAADPKLLASARAVKANSQYYMTWLMRLEGRSRDDWEPEIEAARQGYKLLAEQAEKAGDATAAAAHKEDLEASVRLERMQLSELQGLPLPKKCNGCCSCNGKGKQKKEGKQKPQNKDIRSAGSGAVPETGGR